MLNLKSIVINTDNESSQKIPESGSCRDPISCACTQIILEISCIIEIKHKPGKHLDVADALTTYCYG